MPGLGLPTNLDTTYADDGTDPSVKAHQQYHDAIHGQVNQWDTATREDRDVFAFDIITGLFVPRALTSADVGTTAFELTPGGNYTFVLDDVGKLKGTLTSDTAAVNFTIPANATTPFPIGATMKALQRGTGQITTVGAAGVGLLAVGSAYKSAGTGGTLLYTKLFVDTWLVEGGVL